MSTFGDLKQQASGRLQDDNNTAVSASIVGAAINSAVKYWKQRRFWFNEGFESVVLTAGSPVIPIVASDILYILPRYGMALIDQQMTYNLRKVDPAAYNSGNILQNGRPYAYTWIAGQYLTYFYPQSAYTVNVTFIRDYDDLVNDSDSNDFTINADQLILYDAMMRLNELRTDPAMSDNYQQKRDMEEKNLIKRTNKMIGTGKMRGDGSPLYGYNPYYYYNYV